MGIFGFFKKANAITSEKDVLIKKCHKGETITNYQKDEAGLYPQEILMLSYLEQYATGKEYAKFWEREYGVDDIPSLISSLEQRGFAESGKLTALGKSEIERNEYVLYMHRHKFTDISMSQMSILVNSHRNIKYRDLLWGEFNRILLDHMKNRRFGMYRNTKYTMYKFLLEEKRYIDALPFLAESFFYDLNGSASPFIAPALIEDIKNLERKIDFTCEKMIDTFQCLFSNMYAPFRNYSNDDVICIIVAYAFGNDEMAENIFQKNRK